MAEENWWDKFTTGLGDVLIAPQQPWGTSMPGMPEPTPAQRAAMISSTLLSLGGALSQGARQRRPIGESLAAGWQAAQRGGVQRGQQQLQGMALAGKLGEAKRRNETIEMLARTAPPPGVDPEVWRGMVAIDPGKAFQLYVKAATDERIARAYGGGTDASSADGDTHPGIGARPVQAGAARAFRPAPHQPGSVASGSVAGSIVPTTDETAELPPTNVPVPNVGQPGWRPPVARPVVAGAPMPAQPVQATLRADVPRAGTMALRARTIPATAARTPAIDPRQLLPQSVPTGQILMDKAGNRYAHDPRDGRWKDIKTGRVYVPDVRLGPAPMR